MPSASRGPRTRAALSASVVLLAMVSILLVARAQAPGAPAPVGVRTPVPASGGVTMTATAQAELTTATAQVTQTASAPGAVTVTATAAPPAPPRPVPSPSPRPAPPPPSGPSLITYKGLGAWVSLYDFAFTTNPIDPAEATSLMASHGVQTLYLQTSRWNLPAPVYDSGVEAQLIQDAHAHGIKVVGWYLPGFADARADVANALAVLNFRTSSGQRFDGLALDIEDKSAVGGSVSAFDAGIVTFSRDLRAAVGHGVALGAIVPDAVNNQRYPAGWVGFPWPEIARDYDVVMPMAYWSVTKPSSSCLATQEDTAAYTRSVYHTTITLMGTTKPILLVGGVGDCDTLAEVQGYVTTAKSLGTLGAGIYSFETVEHNPSWSGMWKALQAARR